MTIGGEVFYQMAGDLGTGSRPNRRHALARRPGYRMLRIVTPGVFREQDAGSLQRRARGAAVPDDDLDMGRDRAVFVDNLDLHAALGIPLDSG